MIQGSALISLEEFFNLTGMQFMDDLFSAKRKSSARDDAETTTSAFFSIASRSKLMRRIVKAKPTFADQMVAMGCLVHMLEMYHSVCAYPDRNKTADRSQQMARELRTVMNEDVEWMDDIAEKVEQDVQPVFKRYLEAGEEERAAMEVRRLFLLVGRADIINRRNSRLPKRTLGYSVEMNGMTIDSMH